MPGRKKKPFIDRKNAISFHLVHRSQRDPLQADDESSKFVLVQAETTKEKEVQKAEERSHGVFYDDDYDYLQHLKEADRTWLSDWGEPSSSARRGEDDAKEQTEDATCQVSGIVLPADVFASKTEETVGLLNKAAPISGPRLDLDPDLVAAMDEDFDFEDADNILEDDFVLMAHGDDSQRLTEDGEDDDDYSMDDLGDSDTDDDEKTYLSEETKTRFTNYSMTSSIMRRNEGLTLLDERFEKLYEQYDDMEIGALDHDDIDGPRQVDAESALMRQVMDEFNESQRKSTLSELREEAKMGDAEHPVANGNEDTDASDDENDEALIKMTVSETIKREEQWDCESILSTYSNIYNHPTTIHEPSKRAIKLSQKTGMPLNVLPRRGPTRKEQERVLHDEYVLPSMAPMRPRDRKETPEERRSRKQAVKSERRDRRLEKKANQTAFKEEEIRQAKVMQNLKQNMQGIKVV